MGLGGHVNLIIIYKEVAGFFISCWFKLLVACGFDMKALTKIWFLIKHNIKISFQFITG